MDQSGMKKTLKLIEVPFQSIDLEALEKLKNQAEDLFKNGVFSILMDMSKVNYLSSTGLGLLVYINNKCMENGGQFGVFGLQDYTLDMIKLTKLDSVISIYESQSEAQESISKILGR